MATTTRRVPLTGSDKAATPAPRIGTPPARASIRATVHLRERDALVDELVARLAAEGPGARRFLTRSELAERHGADPADIRAVRDFADEHGLHVAHVDPGRRTVELSGTVADMEAAFGTTLSLHADDTGVFRARRGPLTVPEPLEPAIVAVLGLDDRRAARPHFVIEPSSVGVGGGRGAGAGAVGVRAARSKRGYDPNQVAALYGFPAGVTGRGQTVAIIELGGGFHADELDRFFTGLGLVPPDVTAVAVGRAANRPSGDPSSDDGEVVLDVEVVGAVAPDARVVVYFAENSSKGFTDAVLAAVHDDQHRPSIISISWGLAEIGGWTGQARAAMDKAFMAATAVGVTVFAASGDNLASDGMDDGDDHVDYPASSPHVVGCGGTRLTASGGSIRREVVWNADGSGTGGGVSEAYPVPDYQRGLTPPPTSVHEPRRVGRGVPDVAGVADPATGYRILVDGRSVVVGGTSAVAPLWAGLAARLQEHQGRPVAPLHPALYRSAEAFRDITTGDNGTYSAGPGWDACTGLGSPDGAALLAALDAETGPTSGHDLSSGASGSPAGRGGATTTRRRRTPSASATSAPTAKKPSPRSTRTAAKASGRDTTKARPSRGGRS